MTSHRAVFSFSLALAACASLTPRPSLAQDYVNLPGTQPGGLSMGSQLESAGSCTTSCHALGEPDMPAAMPYDTWIGSMMGNTMRDPLFLAALTVANQDRPGVGDYCLRCHTPTGFVSGRTRGTPMAPIGASLESQDRDGVNCDSCHRMVTTTNQGNAQYEISPSETRFGPYAMITSARHPGAASTWLADSRMCGTCHDITNPSQTQRSADGTDTGRPFPLDTTYSEWSRSAFAVSGSADARTCQDCHMPRVEGQAQVSTNSIAPLRDRPRRHDLTGGNAWALRVLGTLRNQVDSGEFYDPLAVPYYEAGARRAEALLRTAVSLEIRQAPMSAAPGARVEVVARITNRSGHRVPTGYVDGRRVWLTVEIIDADRQTTVVSGDYDAAAAHLADTDPQLRLYEASHGRAGMGHSEHLALTNTVLRDTRLPPVGYRPLPGHEPVGVDYSGGADGALRHWDDARYMVTIPATARGSVTVRVRARYQTTTREYVEALARENRTDTRGQDLLRLYQASGRAAPFDMAEASAQIAITGSTPDAGTPDGGARDAGTDSGMRDEGPATQEPTCGCHTVGRRGTSTAPIASLALALALAARRRRARRA